jgi:hypothetical protein
MKKIVIILLLMVQVSFPNFKDWRAFYPTGLAGSNGAAGF